MRNRMNIVVLASLLLTAALVWTVARTQRTALRSAAASIPMVSVQAAAPAPMQVEIVQVPAPISSQVTPLPAAVVTQIDADGAMKHVAQPGETVTSLAGDLLGKDSKTNRDAIINANASLKSDPDKLVAGKTYRIPPASEIPAIETAPSVPALAVVRTEPDIKPAIQPPPTKVLKYTAAPGDTVGKMAAAFLGSDAQENQSAIINANPSLRADPDHVEVGRAYRIPAPDGLSAAATETPAVTTARPTTQPDADQIVVAGSPRSLRYTAHEGDTVSKMAIQLLGSDTQETRDLIISNNPSLKKDPDRVIAGQTYWIPAPSASADVR